MISRNAIYSQFFPKVKNLIEDSFTCPQIPICPDQIICPITNCPAQNITCPIITPQNITATCNCEDNKESASPIF
jgi:hypothetical protein